MTERPDGQAIASGLDEVRAVIRSSGTTPGIGRTLGIAGIEADEGRVVLVGTPTVDHYNPLGTVHGGYIATMLDGAIALAVHSMLQDGRGCATTDLKIAYLHAVTIASGTLRCESGVLNMGRRSALGEARVWDGEGRLCAHATATCLIVEGQAASS